MKEVSTPRPLKREAHCAMQVTQARWWQEPKREKLYVISAGNGRPGLDLWVYVGSAARRKTSVLQVEGPDQQGMGLQVGPVQGERIPAVSRCLVTWEGYQTGCRSQIKHNKWKPQPDTDTHKHYDWTNNQFFSGENFYSTLPLTDSELWHTVTQWVACLSLTVLICLSMPQNNVYKANFIN
jgi:hypothetical protein